MFLKLNVENAFLKLNGSDENISSLVDFLSQVSFYTEKKHLPITFLVDNKIFFRKLKKILLKLEKVRSCTFSYNIEVRPKFLNTNILKFLNEYIATYTLLIKEGDNLDVIKELNPQAYIRFKALVTDKNIILGTLGYIEDTLSDKHNYLDIELIPDTNLLKDRDNFKFIRQEIISIIFDLNKNNITTGESTVFSKELTKRLNNGLLVKRMYFNGLLSKLNTQSSLPEYGSKYLTLDIDGNIYTSPYSEKIVANIKDSIESYLDNLLEAYKNLPRYCSVCKVSGLCKKAFLDDNEEIKAYCAYNTAVLLPIKGYNNANLTQANVKCPVSSVCGGSFCDSYFRERNFCPFYKN